MDEKWTNRQIAEKANWEGLDYMITGYLSADDIADPQLADAWRRAKEAFAEIETILAPEFEALEEGGDED